MSRFAQSARHFAPLPYMQGDGVSRNVTVARQWYEKAAALGNLEAKQNLREIRK
jgi:TPR repeat protein